MGLEKLENGVSRYTRIISSFRKTNVSTDTDFQRLFKGYYFTAPKKPDWYEAFFSIFEDYKNRSTSFGELLKTFAEIYGTCEASYISKMFATFDDNQIIIDSKILGHFGLSLNRTGTLQEKIKHAINIHNELTNLMNKSLQNDDVQRCINEFDHHFDGNHFTPIKKLDFLIYGEVIK